VLRSEQSSGAAATDGIWNVVKDTGMSDSTWHSTIASEAPKHEAQGTVLPPVPEQNTILPPKRNHNRRPGSTCKGREPLTTEQQQRIVTLAASGLSQTKISKTIGKSRNMIKTHLAAQGVMDSVRKERIELAELYRQKAYDCAIAIDDAKIQKSSALQLATASAICLDKHQLLSGRPTQNVAVVIEILDALVAQRDKQEEQQWQADHARYEQQKRLADEERQRQRQIDKARMLPPVNQA
jgi:hypothetical protein